MTIDRVERPSYDDFRRHYLSPKRPALITGAMGDWPAMQSWDFERIGEKLGDRQITPVILDGGNFHIDLQEGVRVEAMDFRTYAGHLAREGTPPYYLRLPLEGPIDALFRDDYRDPVYCSKRIFLKKNLWVGARGASSDLHYDMTHNVVAQVRGRRSVLLFAPEETPNLHPFPLRTLNWHHSQVWVEAPDLQRFPRFARARAIELHIEAGEMLFIPQGWWHRFSTLESSIAVNFFWLTKRLAPAMAVARAAWVLSRVRT